ncbi:30S ribosomal protein S6 [Candidatus Gottesmanbacteria bacterium RIFCSPLOWO2_02_FULL_38_8]|nr:MAG: 30S ribosomal protein S6 [Candidatus Gottesmanbacteria bacterium RIFCSPLOWO2_02_FULL_38_8]
MLIERPGVSESEEKKLLVRLEKLLEGNGKIVKTENLGKKALSYRIKKETEGKYWLLNLEIKPASVSEFSAKIKMEEDILRFLILRKKIKAASVKVEKKNTKEKENKKVSTKGRSQRSK